jgi:hypothetical protein
MVSVSLLDVNVLLALAWPTHVHHSDRQRRSIEIHRGLQRSSTSRHGPDGRLPSPLASLRGPAWSPDGTRQISSSAGQAVPPENSMTLGPPSPCNEDAEIGATRIDFHSGA